MFLDELNDAPDPALMSQVQGASEKLLQLKFAMEVAEQKFEQAKKEYSTFACKQLPELFRNAGLSSLSLSNGTRLSISTKTRCSIKKDDVSRNEVSQWLQEKGAGNLVRTQFIVPSSQEEALRSAGITFECHTDVNTNSVKALLIDMLGQTGGVALINKDDIPAGISFFQWDEAEVLSS